MFGEGAAVRSARGKGGTNGVPIFSRIAERAQAMFADALEYLEKLLFAVDMAFGDLPVIGAGITRFAV